MTLTRFLTAYIYNPIVMRITRSRMAAGKPLPRRGKMSLSTFVVLVAYPTVLTMFISGVWHGAGWQFVVFGLLHGFYLVVAHGFRAFKARQGLPMDSDKPLYRAAAVLLTFLCVVVAMVFFRADSVPTALAMLAGMAGLSELSTDFDKSDYVPIVLLMAFVWLMPNVQQWMARFRTSLDAQPREHWLLRWFPFAMWAPAPAVGLAIGVLGFFALAVAFSVAPTEFLYFQF